MSRILLVEDEEHLAEGLAFNLRNSGYDVRIAATGERAIELIESLCFDLIILDVMLPGLSGLDVARQVRRAGHIEPILLLTAKNRTADAISGLDAGADDYVTKPFDLDELLARIRSFLRREVWARSLSGEEAPPGELSYGAWTIDFTSFVARRPDGVEHRLTAREAGMLRLFARRPGEVISRETFLEEVWGLRGELETRTVDAFVRRLRRTFEVDPSNPRHVVSVRGAGYRFVP